MTSFIGLTGGVGSGKTTVADRFAEHGARVVDADRIAREVVEPGSDGLAAVVATFGEGVLGADGALDRAAMAAQVFGDDEARNKLNALLHPRIGAVTQRRFEAIRTEDPDAVIVHDVPLLVENDLADAYDAVVVVLADEDLRVARLAEHRAMDAEDARARIAAQADDEQRIAVATHVIRNDGSLEELRARVDEVWTELVGKEGRP